MNLNGSENRKYYDRDARPSHSGDAEDNNMPTRELITYNDTRFIVIDEVCDDGGETDGNKLEDISNVTEHIRSSRYSKLGEVKLPKTGKELDFGNHDKRREASKATKKTGSRKRRYKPCETATDKSEDVCNSTIDTSRSKRNRESFDKRHVHYSKNISTNYISLKVSTQSKPHCRQDSAFSRLSGRSSDTYSKLDRINTPDKSYKRMQMSDIYSYIPFHERHVQWDDHTECIFTQSGNNIAINLNNPVLYDNELRIEEETQTELLGISPAMDWQYSSVSNRSISPYSEFTKEKPSACFKDNDLRRKLQNNGSFDRNIRYKDRDSIQIEHQSENCNQERDIPDSIIRNGKFENAANIHKEISGNVLHVNPNYIFPGKTLQDELHLQNRNFQENGYFNTNSDPMYGHIPQFNTYDNVNNLLTKTNVANIAVELKDNVSSDIDSTHLQRNIVTNVYRTLVQMRKTNLTPADLIEIMKHSAEFRVEFETEDDFLLLLDKYKDKFSIECELDRQCICTRTNVQICQMFCNNPARQHRCMDLHICKYFMLGSCSMPGCRFSHKLFSSHNRNVLRKHDLDTLAQESIKVLMRDLRSRNMSTMPLICRYYNNEGGCQKGTSCMHLHVCRHFINDDCMFGDICKRAHDLNDPQHESVLERHGLNSEGQSYQKVIDLIRATLHVGEGKLRRHIAVFAKEDSSPLLSHKASSTNRPVPDQANIRKSNGNIHIEDGYICKQSEMNEQTYCSKDSNAKEYDTHVSYVQTSDTSENCKQQKHDDEMQDVDLSRLPEYIPFEMGIRLIADTRETGHASPHHIETIDPVVEQVILSCADIVESNTTTEDTKGKMIESNSKTNSNTVQAEIEYPKTGNHSDNISRDKCPLPSWTPLKYERRDITFDIRNDNDDFEDKSNENFGDQNELTISNGKCTTETLFQDVGVELTGIYIQEINSNPPNVSRTMQKSDTVVADASIEKQVFENDGHHEIQAKNIQTQIACTETEKHKPDTEIGQTVSSTMQLCIIDPTTNEEEGNMEASEEECDHVDILDTNKNIPSPINTAAAFEMTGEGDCYHIRRVNCVWQLKDMCGIWKDTECTESKMLDNLYAKFTAGRNKSRRETEHPGTY